MMSYHTSRHAAGKASAFTAVKELGVKKINGRTYKLMHVEAGGLPYYCLRLYNAKNRFIKQFLFEREILDWLMAGGDW